MESAEGGVGGGIPFHVQFPVLDRKQVQRFCTYRDTCKVVIMVWNHAVRDTFMPSPHPARRLCCRPRQLRSLLEAWRWQSSQRFYRPSSRVVSLGAVDTSLPGTSKGGYHQLCRRYVRTKLTLGCSVADNHPSRSSTSWGVYGQARPGTSSSTIPTSSGTGNWGLASCIARSQPGLAGKASKR